LEDQLTARLDGKVAVITGGSSGIGLATAQRFVDEGAYVFIVGRRQSELDKDKALIGDGVSTLAGDVTVSADLDRVFATVLQEEGGLTHRPITQETSWGGLPMFGYTFPTRPAPCCGRWRTHHQDERSRTHATGGYRTDDLDNSVTTRSLPCVVARTKAAMLVISRAWQRYSHSGLVASAH
jgi:NADPH:quinone reductase-like Zn-dependent oxidoreductase